MCSSFFTVCDMVNWLERQSSDHEVTGSTLNPSDDDLEHVIYTFVLLCFRSSQDSDAGEVADWLLYPSDEGRSAALGVLHLFYSCCSAADVCSAIKIATCSMYGMLSVLWRCWLGGRKGIWPVKNMGDGGVGHWLLVRMEWRPSGWLVRLPLLNLPLHHKVQKFSSGTGSPRWSRKKGRKTVVILVACIRVFYSLVLQFVGATQFYRTLPIMLYNALILHFVCFMLELPYVWGLSSKLSFSWRKYL